MAAPITNPVQAGRGNYPGVGALDPNAPTPAERPMVPGTTGPAPGDKQRHPFFDVKDGNYFVKHPERSGYLGRSM